MRIFYLLLTCTLFTAAQLKGQTVPAGSQDPEVKHVKFYPNPATSLITFEFQKSGNDSYSFQVFNFLGRKVIEMSNVTPKTSINLTDFPRGIYIFQIKDQNGRVIESGRFQVNK